MVFVMYVVVYVYIDSVHQLDIGSIWTWSFGIKDVHYAKFKKNRRRKFKRVRFIKKIAGLKAASEKKPNQEMSWQKREKGHIKVCRSAA